MWLEFTAHLWPSGEYGLPKSKSGCPLADGFQWQTGWRYQDTNYPDDQIKSNNSRSKEFHIDGNVTKIIVNRSFCMKDDTNEDKGRPMWPQGQLLLSLQKMLIKYNMQFWQFAIKLAHNCFSSWFKNRTWILSFEILGMIFLQDGKLELWVPLLFYKNILDSEGIWTRRERRVQHAGINANNRYWQTMPWVPFKLYSKDLPPDLSPLASKLNHVWTKILATPWYSPTIGRTPHIWKKNTISFFKVIVTISVIINMTRSNPLPIWPCDPPLFNCRQIWNVHSL